MIARVDALAAVDGAGRWCAPASAIIEIRLQADAAGWHSRLVAIDHPDRLKAHPAASSRGLVHLHRPGSVLIPGLVNAHTHLDLTHLGPQPHVPESGFVAWIDRIRVGRHLSDEAITDSVQHGLRLSLAAGTVAVGDIGGSPRGRLTLAPWRALAESGIRGVSFVEFFGIGRTAERAIDLLRELLAAAQPAEIKRAGAAARLGLQPHAPNTVALQTYLAAIALAEGRLMCTHLAESPEERQFVSFAEGPQRQLLERLGVWDDTILAEVGQGRHPVQHLAPVLERQPMLLAHVNDADDAALHILASSGASVAYCPHASEYFGAERHFGPHRYREMLALGINVAIGTDSIVNLPPGAAEQPRSDLHLEKAGGISVLREIRLLARRDAADPVALLSMATINGARALGLDSKAFQFVDDGPLAGLLAIPAEMDRPPDSAASAARAVLDSPCSPELLLADKHSGPAGILTDGRGSEPTLDPTQ